MLVRAMSTHSETRENREFAREIKFLVPPGRAESIRHWARARLDPDPHAGGATGDIYQISSVYFDTPEFDVYRRTGSYGRAKYRIRRYDDSKKVFLERKLKSRSMVGKRRLVVKLKELERLVCAGPDRDWPGFWFHRRLELRGLAPVCQISYMRTALITTNEFGLVRLTLDERLRASRTTEFRFVGWETGTPMTDGQVIVEMKYRSEMPAVLQELAREFGLVPRPLSKYRLAAAALDLVAESDCMPAEEMECA